MLVISSQFFQQHSKRPAVTDRMVQRQQQQVTVLIKSQQSRAQQRRLLRLNGTKISSFAMRSRSCCSLVLTQATQIQQRQLHRERLIHLLHRLPINFPETAAQHFMPRHYPIQTFRQSRMVHRTAQLHPHRHVVDVTVGFEAIEEPEPLLRKRQRQRLRAVQSS